MKAILITKENESENNSHDGYAFFELWPPWGDLSFQGVEALLRDMWPKENFRTQEALYIKGDLP
jgi:hypothetical protein